MYGAKPAICDMEENTAGLACMSFGFWPLWYSPAFVLGSWPLHYFCLLLILGHSSIPMFALALGRSAVFSFPFLKVSVPFLSFLLFVSLIPECFPKN